MTGLRRNLLVTASLFALCATASAGEWSGFYVGLNAGATGNSSGFTDIGDNGGNASFGGLGTKVRSSGTGPLFGAHTGYNWQIANFVYGLETDWAIASGKSSNDPLTNVLVSTRLDSLGTFRGRVGFTTPLTLVYFTGGFAYGLIHNMLGFPGNLSSFDSRGWRSGWVMGPGFEYLLGPTQSVRIEATHSDFGSWDVASRSTCVGHYRTRFSHSETTVRGALSVKW